MNDHIVCEWECEEEGYDGWMAGCSTSEKPHNFVFNEGGPIENGFIYCPYCARLIKEQNEATR